MHASLSSNQETAQIVTDELTSLEQQKNELSNQIINIQSEHKTMMEKLTSEQNSLQKDHDIISKDKEELVKQVGTTQYQVENLVEEKNQLLQIKEQLSADIEKISKEQENQQELVQVILMLFRFADINSCNRKKLMI